MATTPLQKIDEYLAMGKPTVATSTHTMRNIFAAYTHLATNPQEWLSAIDHAITESDDEKIGTTTHILR